MPLNNIKPHHAGAAAYSTSALPWVTGSVAGTNQRWDFPKVTKTITVRNTDTTVANGLYVAWTENGLNGDNRFLIPGGESETFDVRCKSIWISSASAGTPEYSLYAGLTVVASHDFPLLTGSVVNPSSPLAGENWNGIG